MTTNYGRMLSTRQTPQSEPIPGSNQVPNSAGGYAWQISDWDLLRRFLILGTEGGTYYATEQEATLQAGEAVRRCIAEDGRRVVREVVEISEAGRAPKNDPALVVLAMCAGADDAATRQAALDALPRVARTASHLFRFVEFVEQFRGWGRALRRAVARWYLDKDLDALAYQLIKYRQRYGWSHRDVLRVAHPVPSDYEQARLLGWAAGKVEGQDTEALPRLVQAFERLQRAENIDQVLAVLDEVPDMPWETVPSRWLSAPEVWRRLLPRLPMTALLRNLARMTANRALVPMSDEVALVVERLTDVERLRRARIHPVAVLSALTTYRRGQGWRGDLTWDPIPAILDALDTAFELSFQTIEPSGRRMLLALDVSASMDWGAIAGVPGLTPRMASAAMAMATLRTEPVCHVVAFCDRMVPVHISATQRIDDVVEHVSSLDFGGTDCALPMLYAMEKELEVDVFVVYTDSETWYGDIHPAQALQEYRRQSGIPAKLVVVGMLANSFSIADPNDPGMLDVVGFDTATPQAIAEFAKLGSD